MADIDIQEKHLKIIKKILAERVPQYKIWVFGSRVTNTAKPHSDLDLAIISDSPIPTLTIALLKEAFSNSDLPYKVDVVDWCLTDEWFQDTIRRNHVVIQKNNNLS